MAHNIRILDYDLVGHVLKSYCFICYCLYSDYVRIGVGGVKLTENFQL